MSLFSFRVPREYFNVTHDVMRMACIQIVVQFLFSVANAEDNPFFSVMFLQTIAFVVLGVLFYWLVVRYLVRVDTDASSPPDRTYSPATHTQQMDELWTNGATDAEDAEDAKQAKQEKQELTEGAHTTPHQSHASNDNENEQAVE